MTIAVIPWLEKKIEKKERNKSQPQKAKKGEVVKKEKEAKTIVVSKEDKESNSQKIKKIGNKNDKSYAQKLKIAKNILNNKNEIIGELEFNNMKNNKKLSENQVNKNEYNVVSVSSKSGKIKKEKVSKK